MEFKVNMLKNFIKTFIFITLFLSSCIKIVNEEIEVKCAMCTTSATVYYNIPMDGYPKVYSDSIVRCDISINRFERINSVNTPPLFESEGNLIKYTKSQTRCKWID